MRNIILLTLAIFSFIPDFGHSQGQTPGSVQVIKINVTVAGYEPDKIEVKSGVPVKLEVTRITDSTCATEIRIPQLKVDRPLALNKTEVIELGSLKKGTYKFGCAMDMMIFGHMIAQ